MNSKELKGYFGESIAILMLMIKGYKILERRYKNVCGEIDIIARKRDTIVFVEVKSRKNEEKCYEAINHKQIGRIRRASEIFIKQKRLFDCFVRYDVVLVPNWSIPIHEKNISV